jgi:hypothetical protein
MTLHSPGNLHNAWPSFSSFGGDNDSHQAIFGISGADLLVEEYVSGKWCLARQHLYQGGQVWNGQELKRKLLNIMAFTKPEWDAINLRVTTDEEYAQYLTEVRV